MLRVGLTGGMACGKSAVLRMLAGHGAYTIQADAIAHELMSPGGEVYEAVVAAFGRDILAPDGTIARPKLAAAAFPDRAEELNRLVHPAVIRAQEQWMDETLARDPAGVAIVEAALIFEAGVGKRFDKIVVVSCRGDQKAHRMATRSGISLEQASAEVERRMKAQLPDEEKVRRGDWVIDNSGTLEETAMQVERVWAEMQRIARQNP